MRVAPLTRERVRRVAREMGYVRNSVAATLATRKESPVRGLAIAVVGNYQPLTYEAGQLGYEAIKNRLHELGYVSHSVNLLREGFSAAKLRSLAYHRGYAGIVFGEIRGRDQEIFSLDWSPFCLVSMSRYAYAPPCNMIRQDPFGTVTLAWKEIRKAGYRRAGFLLCSHSPMLLDDFERKAAFQFEQGKLQSPEEAIPPYLGGISDQEKIMEWYYQHRPDVVVGFNQGHLILLQLMGLRIPEDVAYVDLQGPTQPGMAAVCPGNQEVPILCAEHIDFLIRHKRTGYPQRPWTMVVDVSWIPGETMPSPALPYQAR